MLICHSEYHQDHTQIWTIQNIFTGHQPVNPRTRTVENLSCGFWASLYAILSIFETPIKSDYLLSDVVRRLKNIVLDYETGHLGGLSKQVMLNNYSTLKPNLRVRLLIFQNLNLVCSFTLEVNTTQSYMFKQWAPHRHNQVDPLAPVQPNQPNFLGIVEGNVAGPSKSSMEVQASNEAVSEAN